jgi:hypothetical protein
VSVREFSVPFSSSNALSLMAVSTCSSTHAAIEGQYGGVNVSRAVLSRDWFWRNHNPSLKSASLKSLQLVTQFGLT